MAEQADRLHEVIASIAPGNKAFVGRVVHAMEAYFGTDARRIAHAHAVAGHACELLAYIDADPVLTMTAAYLHDIGIHEAERRHGSNAGNFQEMEGPPIARRILEELEARPDFMDTVAEIVGKHHTPHGVDSPEFRILWDADALVNFAEVLPGKPAEVVVTTLRRHMVTEAGYRAACRSFLEADAD